MSIRSKVLVACLVAFLATSLAVAQTPIGQVLGRGALVDGVPVPPGTTLLSPVALATGARPVVLHLENGQAITVAARSAARLESLDRGRIRVTTRAGELVFRETAGEVVALTEGAELVLDEEGRVAEPAGEESTIRLCRVEESEFVACSGSAEAARDCRWELIRVPPAEAEDRLGVDAVLAGVRNNELKLDSDCRTDRTALWIGVGLGSVAAGLVVIDQIDDDDERVASRIRP